MAHDPYALSDEDRLPWLEPVDEVDETPRGPSLGWVMPLLGLLLLAVIAVGAVWWWQNREVTPSGSGALIQAPKEPYKVRPAEEGGTRFEGQGDVVYKTSQGQQVEGSLDLSAVPEAPVTRAPPAPRVEPKPARSATAEVEDGDAKPLAKAPPPAAAEPEGPAGATIQLGAFPSEASAKKSWDTKSKRFAYLADLGHSVLKADVNGRTYYRLRVTAGSAAQAKDICARLKVAGESCLVVQ
ncbi:SPOR domain-containing protein [Sphingomonas sp. MAH-20]|uniref:SPOR domain-containing protein n=1 Tax=Sphingomonas horti TaxID=2682842 RepID=A0A6I4J245_9SPHN|nr:MULTISPECIES: SPOR domain-containing protein [Sphingomonas]MBA2918638.1 SPOR domain-containing protein [Sphingomonas sp. CGMCC 1.13658]MVO78669.1 SPOR domain-containing protein [Sphingomonas horti]